MKTFVPAKPVKKQFGAEAAVLPMDFEVNVTTQLESCLVSIPRKSWRKGRYMGKKAQFAVVTFTLNGYRFDAQFAQTVE